MGSNDPNEEIGTLVVVVLKARNLRDKHRLYKQDAFAQATLNKVTKRTQVDVRGGQHPVWDEELRFPILKRVSDETRKLEVSCWSKEPRTDECVGKGEVDITETLKTGEFDDWVPLKLEDGTYRGELYLEMTYYAKTPPLQRRASKWKPAERLARPSAAYAYPDNGLLLPAAAAAQATHTPSSPTSVPGSLPAGPQLGINSGNRPSVGHHFHQQVLPHRSPIRGSDALPPLPEEPIVAPVSIPAILRPGAGPSRTSPGTSPRADELLLPPDPPLNTSAPPPPPRDPSPIQLPFESVPPYLRPGGGHTPIPEPHIPGTQGHPPPLQNYTPVSQPYVLPSHSYTAPYHYSSPPRQALPLQPHGSPPRQYAPPPQPPYIPPAPLYPPYAYAPPAPPVPENPSLDELPDPYLQARYSTPLPLPNEPHGGRTTASSYQPPPSPIHPDVQTSTPGLAPLRTTSPPPPPKDRYTTPPPPPKDMHTSPASPVRRPVPAQPYAHGPTKEEEERDRLLALQLEKEEEERQRQLREQEERDQELARQLDLELNLERENAAAREAEGGRVPGAW